MSMLKIETRKKYFKALRLGESNSESVLRLQEKYFSDPDEHDGEYGPKTDILLRHVYNVLKYTKNFSPEEFKCGCGGRFCTGYPDYLKKNEALHIQHVRDYNGGPVKITSGLRCRQFNTILKGSSKNSGHLTGRAVDFYAANKGGNLRDRKKLIEHIKHYDNHIWSYCNGWSSARTTPYAPNMGQAIHTETK